MALVPGVRLGSYTIIGALGAGGMGEVYRAEDTRLGRTVAIKFLPRGLTADADRLARFRREGRLLASLNHPNIGAIYGVEESDGIDALILEFVEGETLAEQLRRRSGRAPADAGLPAAEASAMARQIADALEAAHERGIIHRDLKPANVMITPDGVVKVLDFGLARAGALSDEGADNQTTMTSDGTRSGMVMGTAAYMSPEQARGLPVDKRTDVWAFGCVLYEMLAGRPVFAGATITDVLAAVLQREPDLDTLPAATPIRLRRLIERCLVKDAKLRLRDIGEARIALASVDASAPGTVGPSPATDTPRRRVVAAAVAALVTGVLAFALGYGLRRAAPDPAASAAVTFSIAPPSGSFMRSPSNVFMAFSPDALTLALVSGAGDAARIWLRSVSSLEAKPLAGTEGASSPFWSPDGRLIGFFAGGQLKRVDVLGGAPVKICDVKDFARLHGTWGSAGTILYGSSDGSTIFRVPAAGGSPEELITRDRAKSEARTHWPMYLPDGQRFIFLTRMIDGSGRLTLARPDGSRTTIASAISNVQWVDPDFLLFVQDGVLVGQRFDQDAGKLVGDPLSIVEPVDYHYTTARALFTASRTGAVAYHSHSDTSKLVWRTRQGAEAGTVGKPGGYLSVRISPDGRTVLFDRMARGSGSWDLWTVDLTRDYVETNVTSDRGSEVTPVWRRDSRGFVFGADRGGPPHLYTRDLTSGEERELKPAEWQQMSMDISGDGRLLFVERSPTAGNFDLFVMPLENPGAITPLVPSRFPKGDARFSPADDQVISYLSSETPGWFDVRLLSLAEPGSPITVSSGGARLPRWSRDGSEMFYLTPDQRVIAVPVQTKPRITIGRPTTLFTLPAGTTWNDVDVSPDGRFLTVVPITVPGALPVSVLLNGLRNRAK
jgi:Tol biopolymer transport system component